MFSFFAWNYFFFFATFFAGTSFERSTTSAATALVFIHFTEAIALARVAYDSLDFAIDSPFFFERMLQ